MLASYSRLPLLYAVTRGGKVASSRSMELPRWPGASPFSQSDVGSGPGGQCHRFEAHHLEAYHLEAHRFEAHHLEAHHVDVYHLEAHYVEAHHLQTHHLQAVEWNSIHKRREKGG